MCSVLKPCCMFRTILTSASLYAFLYIIYINCMKYHRRWASTRRGSPSICHAFENNNEYTIACMRISAICTQMCIHYCSLCVTPCTSQSTLAVLARRRLSNPNSRYLPAYHQSSDPSHPVEPYLKQELVHANVCGSCLTEFLETDGNLTLWKVRWAKVWMRVCVCALVCVTSVLRMCVASTTCASC